MKTSPPNTPPVNGHACASIEIDASSADLLSAADLKKNFVRDLFTAIECRDVDAVIRLAPHVDDLDSHFDQDYNERPLMLAARHDLPVAAFQVLLERSNPRLTNADGATPLIFAAWGIQPHSPHLARLLLPLSNPKALCGANSALHYAITAYCFAHWSTETISRLLPVSDLSRKDVDGLTPLEQARRANCDDVVELILGEMARRESEELARSAGSPIPMNSPAPRL